MAYLSARALPGNIVSSLLAMQQDEKINAGAAASEFFRQHRELWIDWMEAEVAGKITDAISTPH